RARRVEQERLVVRPLRLGGGKLRARATRLHHATLDDFVERGEDRLERGVRPEAGSEVVDGETDFVAAFLDRRGYCRGAVVGGGFPAPTEEVEVLLLGLGTELYGLRPGGRRGPAIVLEELRRVPDGVDRHHVVEGD